MPVIDSGDTAVAMHNVFADRHFCRFAVGAVDLPHAALDVTAIFEVDLVESLLQLTGVDIQLRDFDFQFSTGHRVRGSE